MIWNIQTFETIDTTQAMLKELAATGAPEGTGIQAFSQTGGYGRRGRQWVSPPGNLYLSLLLRPPCKAAQVPQMALVAGVTLVEALSKFTQGATLKWPNDIFIAGKKVAGILLESDLDGHGGVNWVALGVGVNIVSAPPEIGTALNDHADVDLDMFRTKFLERLEAIYALWLSKGLDPVRALWIKNAHPLGTPLKIKLGDSVLEGYFDGLDAGGNLLLKLESDRVQVVAAGEVHFG